MMKPLPHQSATIEQYEVKFHVEFPPSDISRIQKSFGRIMSLQGDQLARRFYDLLFLKFPEFQEFFNGTNFSQQEAAFVDGLCALVRHLERPQQLRADLVRLGRRHQRYGMTMHHYPPVADALLQVLTELAGEGMDGKTYAGWANFLHLIRAIMLENHSQKAFTELPNRTYQHTAISDHTKRILLIDDDQSLLDLYQAYLEIQGYLCSQVDNVGWAFIHLGLSHYDLVLTDFQMPEMNGLQIKKNLDFLGNGACPPFILITGNLSPEIRKQALELGFQAVLKKPHDIGELGSIIGKALKTSCTGPS